MLNKIMETFAKMLFQKNNDRPESSESERSADDDIEAKTIGVEDGKS